jgi:high-affinity iron transporter
VLGLQPQPTVGEAAGWLIYALPMLAFVCWPAARSPKHTMRGATT